MQDFDVGDFRGNGAGWHLNVHATQFAEWDQLLGIYALLDETLPAESLSLTAPTATVVGDTTSPPPTISADPYTVDGTEAVQFARAAADEGMGEYTFTFGADSLTLAIPPTWSLPHTAATSPSTLPAARNKPAPARTGLQAAARACSACAAAVGTRNSRT